jgi:O-antigen/teichoic acid export membrane protein
MSQSLEASAPDPLLAETKHQSALDGALLHGIAWTGGIRWASQILTWVATLVVARLLSPEDYGLVAMATVYLGLVTLISEFGIGVTIVTMRDLTGEQVAQINTLALLLGLACFLVSCVAAVPLGWFFHEPQLPPVIIALSVAFVISAIRTVPYSLLQRELRFKRLALMDGGQAILTACTMMALAFLGLRYWTLVIGSLLSATVSTAIIVAQHPHRFARPRLQAMRHAVSFSWYVLIDRLAWYSYSNADFLVAGKMLGRAALGAYGFAFTLANVPTEKVTALVANVTTSVFSAVQKDPVALRRYLLSITEGIALITMPATFGLAFVAHDFVLAALGPKWLSIIVPLQLLAVNAAVRSLTPLLPQVLFVTGDAPFVMRTSLLGAVLLPLAFYIGARWGIVGIAAGWLIANPIGIFPQYWRLFNKLDLSTVDYLRALRPALTAVAFMGLAMWAFGALVPPDWSLALRVVLQVLAGGLAYLAALILLHRERLREFLDTLKLVRS